MVTLGVDPNNPVVPPPDRATSQFQQRATSARRISMRAEKAGCSIGGSSTAVVSISSP
jgi:hypothetical protein